MTTADLGDHVLRYQPAAVGPALERLVRAALVESEAARERVEVAPATLDSLAARALDDRLRRLRIEYGAGADDDDLLRRTTGRTVAALREDLRRALRVDLLRERLARLDALRRDGIDLRVLVAADQPTAARIAAQWRDGADAGLLATRFGLRPPETPPAVVPADVPDPRLRERLVAASAGAVLDPVPFEVPDPVARDGISAAPPRTAWQVFKVVRTWRASSDPWTTIAPRVESWLREAPPTEDELLAWEGRAARRAGVAVWDRAKGFGASPPAGTMAPR